MLNAHDAHLPSFSLNDDALMTMPSKRGGSSREMKRHRQMSRANRRPLKRINRGASFIRNSITSYGVLPRPNAAKSQVQQIQASPAITRCRSASVPPDYE